MYFIHELDLSVSANTVIIDRTGRVKPRAPVDAATKPAAASVAVRDTSQPGFWRERRAERPLKETFAEFVQVRHVLCSLSSPESASLQPER